MTVPSFGSMFKFLGWPKRSDKPATNGGVNSQEGITVRTGGEAKLEPNEEEEEGQNPEEEKLVKKRIESQKNDRSGKDKAIRAIWRLFLMRYRRRLL